ncbi:MAG: efflux RND transporter periplasmic adaptor subunit, partial [Fidelibacterota bacterium]
EIARIMDYSWVELYLNIPAGDIQQISIGQAVKVTNYSIPDRWFRGEVTEISPTIDPQSRAFTVKVTVKNTDLTLKPGMFVKANVVVRKKTGTIVIPRYAVQSRDDTHIVFIVQKQRAKVREIKKGLEDRENVEVLEGLETGERLVVKGFESLRDGVKVKVSG